MTKLQSALSALASAGITALAFTIITPTETISKVQLTTITSGILAKASPECVAMVRASCKEDDAECLNNPQCAQAVVSDGAKCTKEETKEVLDTEGKPAIEVTKKATCEKITGFVCNGGYQPQAVQECLTAAVEAKAVEGEAVPK